MKALSVRQPWASLIASGKKTIEVRSWRTHYRGPLLICAAKRPSGLGPVGVALAIVNLIDVRPFNPRDARAACCNAAPDGFAWVLRDVRRIDPFPVAGKLKMFEVPLPRGSVRGTKHAPGETRAATVRERILPSERSSYRSLTVAAPTYLSDIRTTRRPGRRSRGSCE
jgi:hypothetical protein